MTGAGSQSDTEKSSIAATSTTDADDTFEIDLTSDDEAEAKPATPATAIAASAAPAVVAAASSAQSGPLSGGATDRQEATDAGAGAHALEALVERALAPLLKDWLDKNMPALVEKVAERELGKLTGKTD